jgi:hypothetical protein
MVQAGAEGMVAGGEEEIRAITEGLATTGLITTRIAPTGATTGIRSPV